MADSLDHDQTDKIIRSYCVIEYESARSQHYQDSLILIGDGSRSRESMLSGIRHQVARLTSDLTEVERNQVRVDESLRKDLDALVQQVSTLTGVQDDVKRKLQESQEEIKQLKIEVNSIKEQMSSKRDSTSSQIAEALNKQISDNEFIKRISLRVSNMDTMMQQEESLSSQDGLPPLTGERLEAATSEQYNDNITATIITDALALQDDTPPRKRSSSWSNVVRPRSRSKNSSDSKRRSMIIDSNSDLMLPEEDKQE